MSSNTELDRQMQEKENLRGRGVDVKTSNTLFRHGLTDLNQIASLSKKELRNIRGIGDVGIAQILNAFRNYSEPTSLVDAGWEQDNQAILDASDHTW